MMMMMTSCREGIVSAFAPLGILPVAVPRPREPRLGGTPVSVDEQRCLWQMWWEVVLVLLIVLLMVLDAEEPGWNPFFSSF